MPKIRPQLLSYMLGLEQMSQLKCLGVFISVAGAVWVELFASTSDWAVAESTEAVAATVEAAEGGGAPSGDGFGSGADGGGSGWLGSFILLWQVRWWYVRVRDGTEGITVLMRSAFWSVLGPRHCFFFKLERSLAWGLGASLIHDTALRSKRCRGQA